MVAGTELITYTSSITGSDILGVDEITPIYWVAIPPRGAVAIPNIEISVMTHPADAIPFDRAGWYEIAGYVISTSAPLSQNLQQYTARQLVDDFIPTIEPPSTANNPLTGDTGDVDFDERFQGLDDNVGPNSKSKEEGIENVKQKALLSHPAVYNAAQELGLGANQVYYYSSGLGAPYGKSTPVAEQRVVYQDQFNVSLDAVRSTGTYNFFVLVSSIPNMLQSTSGSYDDAGRWKGGNLVEEEPIAPWTDWGDMINMFNKAPLIWSDAMLSADALRHATPTGTGPHKDQARLVDSIPEHFRSIVEWKRQYRVPDDTWHNSVMRYWIRGDAVMTYPCEIFRKHI